MTWEMIGTAHLGQARCICPTNPEGCPLHQRIERVTYARVKSCSEHGVDNCECPGIDLHSSAYEENDEQG